MEAPTFSVAYSDIRSRQLEGTYPGDPMMGVWPVTSLRIRRGWGILLHEDWPLELDRANWPPSEPPALDEKAKERRILRYQRVTDSAECLAAIRAGRPVGASFEITNDWLDPPDGAIPMPGDPSEIIGSHHITILGFSEKWRRFRFINTWGPDWGERGFGSISFDFFNHCLIEGWIEDGIGRFPNADKSGVQELLWVLPDYLGRLQHVREIYDKDSDDRLAWAFVVERNGILNVEEFFVRPGVRRRGYGRELLSSLTELANTLQQQLVFWIPFADCGNGNLDVFARMLERIDYSIHRSPVRWAAYTANPMVSQNGRIAPHIPARPAYCPRNRKPTPEMAIPAVIAATANPNTVIKQPVSSVEGVDWKTSSDEAFLEAAKSVIIENAALLQRLA
jgi:GNAT superfamily N-acetyltransferase